MSHETYQTFTPYCEHAAKHSERDPGKAGVALWCEEVHGVTDELRRRFMARCAMIKPSCWGHNALLCSFRALFVAVRGFDAAAATPAR